MLTAIAGTMPSRSVILPMMTPPRPKPKKIMVAASETAPRVAANSCCTTGITTTTDHIPTAPTEAISTASASRTQAWRESGVNGGESVMAGRGRARRQLRRPGAPGQATWRDIGHADAAQQSDGRHRPGIAVSDDRGRHGTRNLRRIPGSIACACAPE